MSGGTLEVSVRYLGVSVYSKSGSLCEAVPCPLAVGPARLTLAQQMPSAAPPVSCPQPAGRTTAGDHGVCCGSCGVGAVASTLQSFQRLPGQRSWVHY